ncbi:MAG: hypothetical protein ACRCZZ_05965, partial [Phocaeicola sp.]
MKPAQSLFKNRGSDEPDLLLTPKTILAAFNSTIRTNYLVVTFKLKKEDTDFFNLNNKITRYVTTTFICFSRHHPR